MCVPLFRAAEDNRVVWRRSNPATPKKTKKKKKAENKIFRTLFFNHKKKKNFFFPLPSLRPQLVIKNLFHEVSAAFFFHFPF